jgi:hypothetical protein
LKIKKMSKRKPNWTDREKVVLLGVREEKSYLKRALSIYNIEKLKRNDQG